MSFGKWWDRNIESVRSSFDHQPAGARTAEKVFGGAAAAAGLIATAPAWGPALASGASAVGRGAMAVGRGAMAGGKWLVGAASKNDPGPGLMKSPLAKFAQMPAAQRQPMPQDQFDENAPGVNWAQPGVGQASPSAAAAPRGLQYTGPGSKSGYDDLIGSDNDPVWDQISGAWTKKGDMFKIPTPEPSRLVPLGGIDPMQDDVPHYGRSGQMWEEPVHMGTRLWAPDDTSGYSSEDYGAAGEGGGYAADDYGPDDGYGPTDEASFAPEVSPGSSPSAQASGGDKPWDWVDKQGSDPVPQMSNPYTYDAKAAKPHGFWDSVASSMGAHPFAGQIDLSGRNSGWGAAAGLLGVAGNIMAGRSAARMSSAQANNTRALEYQKAVDETNIRTAENRRAQFNAGRAQRDASRSADTRAANAITNTNKHWDAGNVDIGGGKVTSTNTRAGIYKVNPSLAKQAYPPPSANDNETAAVGTTLLHNAEQDLINAATPVMQAKAGSEMRFRLLFPTLNGNSVESAASTDTTLARQVQPQLHRYRVMRLVAALRMARTQRALDDIDSEAQRLGISHDPEYVRVGADVEAQVEARTGRR